MASKNTSAKPTASNDDFEVVDAKAEAAAAQLPAIAEDAKLAPAVYADDFDSDLDKAFVAAPTLTLVHGVGDYKNNHNIGLFVMGSLERAVELTTGNIEKLKTPERIRAEGRFRIIPVAIAVPVWVPDVKPSHPAFRMEIPTKPGKAHVTEIEAMGGTVDAQVAKNTGKQLFVPKSEVTLLIERPAHVKDEFADMFSLELDGKFYAVARYWAKKSAFTHFVEKLRSLREVNSAIRKSGRWYSASFLVGSKTVETKKGDSFFVPDVVPCPEPVSPAVYEYAQSIDPVPRG